MKPPRLGRGPGSTTGLGALLTSDDDMDACSAAAQAAMSAARLAGYKSSASGMHAAHGVIPGCCPVHTTLPCICAIVSQHNLKNEPETFWEALGNGRPYRWMNGS